MFLLQFSPFETNHPEVERLKQGRVRLKPWNPSHHVQTIIVKPIDTNERTNGKAHSNQSDSVLPEQIASFHASLSNHPSASYHCVSALHCHSKQTRHCTEGSSVAFSRLIPWQLSLLELCRWFQSEGRTGSNRLLKELSANKPATAAWLREWNFVYLSPRLLWKNSAWKKYVFLELRGMVEMARNVSFWGTVLSFDGVLFIRFKVLWSGGIVGCTERKQLHWKWNESQIKLICQSVEYWKCIKTQRFLSETTRKHQWTDGNWTMSKEREAN